MVHRQHIGRLASLAMVVLAVLVSVSALAATVSAQGPTPDWPGWEQAIRAGEHVLRAGEAAERGAWQEAVGELEALGKVAGELAPTPPPFVPEEGAHGPSPDSEPRLGDDVCPTPAPSSPPCGDQANDWQVLGNGGWVHGRMGWELYNALTNRISLSPEQKVDVSPWMMDIREFMYHGEPGVYSQKERVDEAWQQVQGNVHEGSFSSVEEAVSWYLALLRDRIGEGLRNLFSGLYLH